jgi:hypothetical protein
MARGHRGARTGARTGARVARTGTTATLGTRHHRRRRRHRGRNVVSYYPSYPYYPYGYNRYPYREPPYVMMPSNQQQKPQQLSIHLPTIIVSLGLSYLLWGRGR